MPHCLRVASDVDHSNTTSVSSFHEDTPVLFCGPCRLHVLLNRSCNPGSMVQNGNYLLCCFQHSKVLSSTSTRSSEDSHVGLLYSCKTLSHLEKDLTPALGSSPFSLGDVSKMPANQFSQHGFCTGKEGIAASFLGKESGIVGKQFEPPFAGQVKVFRVCMPLGLLKCRQGSQKLPNWHHTRCCVWPSC